MQMTENNDAAASADASPLGPGAVRALKITVVVMGILILIGLALVISRIIQLSSKTRGQTTANGTATTTQTTLTEKAKLAIPAGATIKTISLSGHRLAVHYEAATGSEIAIVDITTGKTVSRIRLVPSAPAN